MTLAFERAWQVRATGDIEQELAKARALEVRSPWAEPLGLAALRAGVARVDVPGCVCATEVGPTSRT